MKLRYYLSEEAQKLGVRFHAPARQGDAGYDIECLYQQTPMHETLNGIIIIRTGLHLEIPTGYYGKVFDRSSLALRSIFTIGGVIDSGYRGELTMGFINHSGQPIYFARGERVAQIIFMAYAAPELEIVDSLDQLSVTERGQSGFGSTGK